MYKNFTFLCRRMSLTIILSVCSLFMCVSSFAQQWSILGNEQTIASVNSANTSIALVKNGVNLIPHIVYTENGVAKVKKRLDDGTWAKLGEDLGNNASYTRIYADLSSDLYVTYVDVASSSKLAIKKYNTVSNNWEPLNNDSNNLYVSAGTVNGMSNVSQYGSTPRSSLAFDSLNNIYVAYGEGANKAPYVKKFDGTSWATVGSGPISSQIAAAISLVIDKSDMPWLSYSNLSATNSSTGTIVLYNFDGTAWNSINVPNPITGATSSTAPSTGVRHTSLALRDENNLCIAYFNTGNSNKATAILYNKTTNTWSLSGTLGSRDSPSLNLINDYAGNLYCSFIDNVASTATYSARVRMLAKGETVWSELKDPLVIRGIDEPTGNLSIAVANNSSVPFVVYTKINSSSVTTPIVRRYIPAGDPIELTTNDITNITTSTAVTGGNITSDGGGTITERGVVYSISNPEPTLADTKVADASGGIGSFSVTLNGLTPATFYYTRAYAIKSGGTYYGNTIRLNSHAQPDAVVTTPKQVEFLTRGLVAVQKSGNNVYLSWRLLGNDPSSIAFNVYRNGVKINTAPIITSTNYTDNTTTINNKYSVKSIVNGVEGAETAPVTVWSKNQLSVPLQIPPGGTLPDGRTYTYTANDASVGDVDGDGIYEVILKWDPTIVNDNAGGYSGKQILDCYKLDGTKLWRIDLGININAGPHYNPFMVYDFDGDGKAEIILKTADGTADGVGNVIGNGTIDYRNTSGWVQQGPEFLTVFNGLTGAAMASINYEPARGNISDWGDTYGNRADRFVSAVAYLDGARPSIVVGRGYYNKLVRAAYNWRDGQLTLLWKFDSKNPNEPANNAYSGQGNHQMTIGDVDGDGKDEIINGSSAINDNGNRLWTFGNGHGDAIHMTDMDLDRPGQEIWINLESPSSYNGMGLRQYDAKTGETNWGIQTTGDVGRSMAADIDPNYRGYEMWGSSGGNVYDAKGNTISTNVPSYNFGIWWDGDLGRELLDRTYIDKWNPVTKSAGRLFTIYQAAPISSNNGTKSNPALQADLFGDWREEVMFRTADNTALIIFTTDIPTEYRIPTLMHDPQYRAAIAWQNSGYNQPPNPSFYIGYDMATTPAPNISIVDVLPPKVTNIARLSPNSEKNNATTVTYRVSFSENVSGVDVDDFVLNTNGNVAGTIASITAVSNVTFDITVNDITGDGTLRLEVNNTDTTIIDESHNILAEGFTNGEIYTFDHTNPAITAPVDITINSDIDSCTATNVVLGNPETSDLNGVEVATNDAPTTFVMGTTIVTWTVKDGVGNSNTAIQKVIVADKQNPLITETPQPITLCYNESGYTIPTISATDNCTINSIGYSITGATLRSGNSNDASGSFNVGISTITWTVLDIHDNQTTVTNTVTIYAPVTVTIDDVYAVNQASKNTLYIGYGPSALNLTAKPNGGTAPYTFTWSTGETASNINISSAGTYNVIITDAKGCIATTSIVISAIDVSCGNKKDKVTICHNGNAICIASSSVTAHLNHGYKLGNCDAICSNNDKPAIQIYPNPTTGQFSIQLNSLKSGKGAINIVNLIGKIIEQRNVILSEGVQTFSFNLNSQPSGLYLIKVIGIDGISTQNVLLKY